MLDASAASRTRSSVAVGATTRGSGRIDISVDDHVCDYGFAAVNEKSARLDRLFTLFTELMGDESLYG